MYDVRSLLPPIQNPMEVARSSMGRGFLVIALALFLGALLSAWMARDRG